jgi:hypothetical protein
MTVWITKYALTIGILEREMISEDAGMVVYRDRGGINDRSHAHGKDWHRTKDEAIARAEEMRVSKIATYKKRIAALEKMRFA